jgi:O-6-methylguanine DNA methyltransferase
MIETTADNMLKYKTISFNTPLGMMTAVSETEGIVALDFHDSINLNSSLQSLTNVPETGFNDHLLMVKQEVEEYFAGKLKEFNVKLSMRGTDFQKKVWTELMKIPYGKTRTYSQQAISLQDIKSIRAVASANGKNKIAIIIPCHRVIGSDGSLTGYAGGLWRKKWLIEFESGVKSHGLFDTN